MATLFIRHTVKDYQAWRKVYDEMAPDQKAFGVTAEAVYHSESDPNDLTVTHDFASLAAAHNWVDSDELHRGMASAGVVGAPTIWFTSKS